MSETSPQWLARTHYIARLAENETAELVFGSGSRSNSFHIVAWHPGQVMLSGCRATTIGEVPDSHTRPERRISACGERDHPGAAGRAGHKSGVLSAVLVCGQLAGEPRARQLGHSGPGGWRADHWADRALWVGEDPRPRHPRGDRVDLNRAQPHVAQGRSADDV